MSIHLIEKLRFQRQADPTWCWAAVGWMVNDCYGNPQGWSQYDIASQLTGGQCGPPLPAHPNPCFTPMQFADVLVQIEHFGGPKFQSQDFDLVSNQIIAQRPICAEVVLPGATHYVVLSACTDDGGIRVFDPEGQYDTDFNTFIQPNPKGQCNGWFLTVSA